MSNTPIEINKDGIKVPYRDFLSDVASGNLLLLIIFLLYYHLRAIGYSIPALGGGVAQPVKVYIVVIFFLLSPALGSTITAISWAILGLIQTNLFNCWYTKHFAFIKTNSRRRWQNLIYWLTAPSFTRNEFDRYTKYFNLDQNNWQKVFYKIRIGHYPKLDGPDLTSIQGQISLFRNIMLLSISVIFISLYLKCLVLFVGAMLALVFATLGGLSEMCYAANKTFHALYIKCIMEEDVKLKTIIDKIVLGDLP